MRSAVYARVSSEEQAVRGNSIDHQRAECTRYARELGADAVLEFIDAGVSGAVLNRPGLNELRRAVSGGEVDLVVAYDPDRLARRLAHQLLLSEELERHSRVVYVNFQREPTPEGNLFYQLRGAIAEYEREKIRERTMAGRRQKALGGRLPFAVEPYGYRYDRSTSSLSVFGQEAEVVRMIFRWYVDREGGLAWIARNLEAMGVPTKRGGAWHRQTVRQMLANSVYRGVYYANRNDMSGVGLNRHLDDRKHWGRRRPREQWIEVPVPPIVDHRTWEDARRLLESGQRTAGVSGDYPLTGLLRCGLCGLSMGGSRGTSWGRRVRRYTCRRPGSDRGCARHVAAGPLETSVWEGVWPYVTSARTLMESLARPESPTGRDGAGEIAGIARRRRRLLALIERGVVPAVEVEVALERLGRREAAARRAMAKKDDAAAADMDMGEAVAWLDLARHRLPRELRRRVLRLAVARIVVSGDEVVVTVRATAPLRGTRHEEGDPDAPAHGEEVEA